MNTPHPLIVKHRISHDRDPVTPVDPHFYLNPPLARTIADQYDSRIQKLLSVSPPGTQYYDAPAIRLFAQEYPDCLQVYFDAWFSPDAPVQTLLNATHIDYQPNHATGISRANDAVAERFQTIDDPEQAAKLCHLSQWNAELFLPQVHQLLHRFPQESSVVFYALMCLDQYGPYEPLEIPAPTVELLKSWWDSDNDNEQYTAVAGLAHTPFRTTEAFGERIRSKIAAGEALYIIGDTALQDNSAPWVSSALAELKDGAVQQPLFAEPLYKYGGIESVEFFQSQAVRFASADALLALRRVKGDGHAFAFLERNLDKNPLALTCLLLEHAGENAVPSCLEHLSKSDDEELRQSVIVHLVRFGLGKDDPRLLPFVETVYRDACESGFRINAKQMLNALTRLGHPDASRLVDLLPGPDPFESPAVTMTAQDTTVEDFVDFLNSRQLEHEKPVSAKDLGAELDVGSNDHFALQYKLHEALLKTHFAMQFDPVDWLSALEPLLQELALLTDGVFVPRGVRFGSKIEISWNDMVFADTFSPYEESPGGLIDLLNAMLDHAGTTNARFVAYPNEIGNEYPTIVFLPAADVKTLEMQFGLKPN